MTYPERLCNLLLRHAAPCRGRHPNTHMRYSMAKRQTKAEATPLTHTTAYARLKEAGITEDIGIVDEIWYQPNQYATNHAKHEERISSVWICTVPDAVQFKANSLEKAVEDAVAWHADRTNDEEAVPVPSDKEVGEAQPAEA